MTFPPGVFGQSAAARRPGQARKIGHKACDESRGYGSRRPGRTVESISGWLPRTRARNAAAATRTVRQAAGPLLATFQHLNNLSPTQPIGDDHVAVHRSHDVGTRLVEDRRDTIHQLAMPLDNDECRILVSGRQWGQSAFPSRSLASDYFYTSRAQSRSAYLPESTLVRSSFPA